MNRDRYFCFTCCKLSYCKQTCTLAHLVVTGNPWVVSIVTNWWLFDGWIDGCGQSWPMMAVNWRLLMVLTEWRSWRNLSEYWEIKSHLWSWAWGRKTSRGNQSKGGMVGLWDGFWLWLWDDFWLWLWVPIGMCLRRMVTREKPILLIRRGREKAVVRKMSVLSSPTPTYLLDRLLICYQ